MSQDLNAGIKASEDSVYSSRAEEELLQYRDALRASEYYARRIDELTAQLESSQRPFTKDKICKSSHINWSEELCTRLADLRSLYVTKQEEAIQVCLRLEKNIELRTSGVYARVLRYIYLAGYSLKMIASIERKSKTAICCIKQEALTTYGKGMQ